MSGKETSSSTRSVEIIEAKRSFSVLIVDDDCLIRRIHRALLSKFTKEIQEVENGQQAVDLHRSGAASFDIILMDQDMPIMNGLEATKELRAMGVNNMIIGVTARDSNKDDLIAAGQNQCYEKPLNIEKMKTILKDCNLY